MRTVLRAGSEVVFCDGVVVVEVVVEVAGKGSVGVTGGWGGERSLVGDG